MSGKKKIVKKVTKKTHKMQAGKSNIVAKANNKSSGKQSALTQSKTAPVETVKSKAAGTKTSKSKAADKKAAKTTNGKTRQVKISDEKSVEESVVQTELITDVMPLSADDIVDDGIVEDVSDDNAQQQLAVNTDLTEYYSDEERHLLIKKIVEGALIAAGKPLNIKRLQLLFGKRSAPEKDAIRKALAELQEDYTGRGVELKEVASGFRFQVSEDINQWVAKLWDERPQRYTRALLETLSIIAYRQPITRGDIEEIRGVAVSTNIIKTLLERDWVRVVGHRDVPGRPALYATTRQFLDYFNLKNLDELPPLSEIKELGELNKSLDLDDEELHQGRVLELPDEETVTDEMLDRDEQGNTSSSATINNDGAESNNVVESYNGSPNEGGHMNDDIVSALKDL